MTETDAAKVIVAWWRTNLRPEEDRSAARALRARLRRADVPEEALAEEAVFELTQGLPWLRARPVALATLARTLARVETHTTATLAAHLGEREGRDGPRAMSDLRFQRLLRTPEAELSMAMRRALPLVDERCNVGRLGRDILDWNDSERGERVRIAWCFDYFKATRDRAPEHSPEESEA